MNFIEVRNESLKKFIGETKGVEGGP